MPFCVKCGSETLVNQAFCSSCGNQIKSEVKAEEAPVINQEVSQPVVVESGGSTWSVGAWLRLMVLLGLGYPALTGAIGMPGYAEYVTFEFNANTITNCGWLIYYWGAEAVVARTFGSGMDAGTVRMILWAIVGFCVALSFNDFAKLIRGFNKRA